MVRLHMQNGYSTSNSWELAGVFSINLAKIDDKLLEVPKDLKLSDAQYSTDWQDSTSGGWWSGNNGGRGFIRPIIRYGTKPDGTGWKDDTEQSNTMIDDLRYWDNYDEAKAHGVIVGFIIASKEAGGNNSESFFPLRAMVHVKNDPANIGKTAQFHSGGRIVGQTRSHESRRRTLRHQDRRPQTSMGRMDENGRSNGTEEESQAHLPHGL